MKSLTERLADIQSSLNAPKGQYNTFGNYSYRSCEDILQAVKPLLNGLVITVNDEMQAVGDRIYVKATATITDGENSISTSAYAREALTKKGMDDSQITGSTSSYARKYALNGLLLIDDNKDADGRDNRNHQQESREAQQAAQQEAQEEARKQRLMEAVHRLQPTIQAIKQGIASGELGPACEAWSELTDDEKRSIWVAPSKGGPFTADERKTMQSREFREAHFGPINQHEEATV